ncbi:hypothetical protein CLHOM_00450 [Clostridium homopropionicum DSM 5847]|uniref:Uncharacterized protein n=1 Tax=Clostridium homopropionicum DSM 5847 TaxID=1121318 RepID=A0A0L6ZEG3_9CLOT|nr:hypothetical protein [Clostridium homopropionicum]KOA21374.1 hypothetical protein CLHOM_00450 [Clostridium homopropionicum DSM 5847]SFG11965.1 hypothetical protein SAMN04488501_105181 [Clostridium homopropionicum]
MNRLKTNLNKNEEMITKKIENLKGKIQQLTNEIKIEIEKLNKEDAKDLAQSKVENKNSENKDARGREANCVSGAGASGSGDIINISVSASDNLATYFALTINFGEGSAQASGSAGSECHCNGAPERGIYSIAEIDGVLEKFKNEEIVIEDKVLKAYEANSEILNLIKAKVREVKENAVEIMKLQKQMALLKQSEEEADRYPYKSRNSWVNSNDVKPQCFGISVAIAFGDDESETETEVEENSAQSAASATGDFIAIVFGFTFLKCKCKRCGC